MWKVKCNVASSYYEISESVTDLTKLQNELQKRIEIDLVKSKSTSIGDPIRTGSAQKYWQEQRQWSGHRRRLPATLLTQLLCTLCLPKVRMEQQPQAGAVATSIWSQAKGLVIVLIRRANFFYKLYNLGARCIQIHIFSTNMLWNNWVYSKLGG